MIRHGCAGRLYNAFGIDSVVRSDGLLQRRVAIAVVAIDFELLQIDRQFAKWKWRHAARCEIEPHAALRLRPMDVVRVLVSHECYWPNPSRIAKICSPRITQINTNREKNSHRVLLECGAPSHRFSSHGAVDPKATRRRVALRKLREIEQKFFPFAFTGVICGVKLQLRRSRGV